MTEHGPFPDFIIGGAPRSGTTYLCHALGRHPGVHVAKPYIPEPKVFMGAPRTVLEYTERYRALFGSVPAVVRTGEKTSYYLESEQACRLIRAAVPETRLVFILREPVARAYSNYLWTRKNGYETLPFAQAVTQEDSRTDPLPPERSYARPFAYISRGDYATFVQRYYDAFGRDRVALYLYEDIMNAPERLFADLQRFIGVEALPFASLDPGPINVARDLGPPLDAALERELRARLRPQVERFRTLSGLDLSAWGYTK
jgi:sulfotransferase family protein